VFFNKLLDVNLAGDERTESCGYGVDPAMRAFVTIATPESAGGSIRSLETPAMDGRLSPGRGRLHQIAGVLSNRDHRRYGYYIRSLRHSARERHSLAAEAQSEPHSQAPSSPSELTGLS
jgi:hypothetical protein